MQRIAKITQFTLDDEKMCSSRVIFADLELKDGETIHIQWARELHEDQKVDFDAVWDRMLAHTGRNVRTQMRAKVKQIGGFIYITV